MSDAPERILVGTARSLSCGYVDASTADDYDRQAYPLEYVSADTLTALQAENARLREALAAISSFKTLMPDGEQIETPEATLARAALEGE